jgi:hypothetical protein
MINKHEAEKLVDDAEAFIDALKARLPESDERLVIARRLASRCAIAALESKDRRRAYEAWHSLQEVR